MNARFDQDLPFHTSIGNGRNVLGADLQRGLAAFLNERQVAAMPIGASNGNNWVIPPDNGHVGAEVRRALRRMIAHNQLRNYSQNPISPGVK